MKYFVHYANQENRTFWTHELKAICELFKLDFSSLHAPQHDWHSPLVVVDLPSDEIAHQIISRSVLAKSLYRLWCEESSFELLCEAFARHDEAEVRRYFGDPDRTFRLVVHAVNKKLSMSEQLSRINVLLQPFDGLPGVVNLNSPDEEFGLFEEYEYDAAKGRSVRTSGSRALFGRLIGHSMRRERQRFRLSERQFIGNTTMDVTLAFLMANMAQVRPHDLVYDPFLGSGSILLACGFFKAYGLGTDIDYNIVHGLGKSSRSEKVWREEGENLAANYQQYGMSELFVGAMVGDSARAGRLFREAELFDAIVTDPPYGIRESSRRVAKTGGGDSLPNHIPAKESYDTQDTVLDLVDFAASRLRVDGRLVFWLPVVKAEFCEENLPRHPAFRIVSQCPQSLGKRMERRLVVMQKVKRVEEGDTALCQANHYEKTFRERYFRQA